MTFFMESVQRLYLKFVCCLMLICSALVFTGLVGSSEGSWVCLDEPGQRFFFYFLSKLSLMAMLILSSELLDNCNLKKKSYHFFIYMFTLRFPFEWHSKTFCVGAETEHWDICLLWFCNFVQIVIYIYILFFFFTFLRKQNNLDFYHSLSLMKLKRDSLFRFLAPSCQGMSQ